MFIGAYQVEALPSHEPQAAVAEGEASLWLRWRNEADAAAREQLLALHMPYAKQVAGVYYSKRFHDEIEYEEYYQMATLGLVEAMERFDPARGVQFRTFAARRMHGSIVDGIEHTTEKQQQIAARQRIESQRVESIRDAAEGDPDAPVAAAPKNTEQLLQYVAQAGIAFALAWLLDGSGMVETGERSENIPFYRSVELRELRERVLELVKNLPAQERTVIHGHYLQEIPFESIATRLGVSRGRISQVHKKALERLRESLCDTLPCDVIA